MNSLFQYITTLDITILDFIQKYIKNDLLDRVIPFITWLGNGGFIWIVLGIVFVLIRRYRKAGIICLITLITGLILGELILKNIVERARPFIGNPYIELLIKSPSSYSFPSGHTASSFGAAAALSKYINSKGIFWVLAFLIAFSRLYLYVHYPTDILGGIILGLISFKIAEFAYNKFLSTKEQSFL